MDVGRSNIIPVRKSEQPRPQGLGLVIRLLSTTETDTDQVVVAGQPFDPEEVRAVVGGHDRDQPRAA
jgi:hypothetical protein